MFENITKFFKKITKKQNTSSSSKDTAKERLHLVLMQDRANVSADFLDLMRQEIIDVIKKYIEVDESAIDVRLTNKENEDGTNGAPALYANIPIINIKEETKKEEGKIAKEKVEAEKIQKIGDGSKKKEGKNKDKDESKEFDPKVKNQDNENLMSPKNENIDINKEKSEEKDSKEERENNTEKNNSN